MTRLRIGVVGAGVSGLAAAHRLRRCLGPDAEILMYDAALRPGGKLRTSPVAGLGGFTVDEGAEAFRRTAGMEALLGELDLADRVAGPRAARPAVYAAGTRHLLPPGTLMGIPTDPFALRESTLLDGPALEHVAREAARPAGTPLLAFGADVALGGLVRDRLGSQVLERLVAPLLAGVYAGDAERLSLRATLPGLADVLESESSLVRAAAQALATARGSAPGTGLAAADPAAFVTLLGGLEQLATALREQSSVQFHGGLPVREIRSRAGSPTGWTVVAGSAAGVGPAAAADVDGVVLATPAGPTARLLRAHAAPAAGLLADLSYASVAVVTLAYRDVELPPGSGIVVPPGSGTDVKAVTFTTQKWPYGAGEGLAEGVTVLRASVGRAGDARPLQRSDAALARAVTADVARVTGVGTQPFAWRVSRWGGALPQYAPGHLQRVEALRRDVAGLGPLAVCGAAYDGVGIPACVDSGALAADALLAALA